MSRHGSGDLIGGDGVTAVDSPDDVQPARRTRRLRRVLLGAVAALTAVVLLVAGGAWYLTSRYAGNLDRVDAFAGLEDRPAAPTAGAAGEAPLTFLVVGSDTRADVAEGELPDARSDVMMLVRFAGDRQHAQVISLPRDSWVSVPGAGMAKLNAAYAWGGPGLLIQTVETMTGVRIDHYAAIDFQGFVEMTDALGGVDVQVAQTVTNGPYTYQAGQNHLDGEEALFYVRQRYGLPGGDFDRVQRQQQYLRSMFAQLSEQDVFSDAGALDGFLRGLTGAMAVDSELSNTDLLGMAYDLRSLQPGNVTFLTAPVAGTGREGAQSVVYLDQARVDQLWAYLRGDSLSEHTGEFGLDTLPAVPN
jgi:LCP family protein required for cell wall assembly